MGTRSDESEERPITEFSKNPNANNNNNNNNRQQQPTPFFLRQRVQKWTYKAANTPTGPPRHKQHSRPTRNFVRRLVPDRRPKNCRRPPPLSLRPLPPPRLSEPAPLVAMPCRVTRRCRQSDLPLPHSLGSLRGFNDRIGTHTVGPQRTGSFLVFVPANNK